MLVQTIARLHIGMYVTPLEWIATLFIFISLFTYILEWAKPKDVNRPDVIHCPSKLNEDVIYRLLKMYKRDYDDSCSDVTDIKRVPFGTMLAFMTIDNAGHLKLLSERTPNYVLYLNLLILFAGDGYNAAHAALPHALLTPRMRLAWIISCLISVSLPALVFPSLFLRPLQKYFNKFPDWVKEVAWRVAVTLYFLVPDYSVGNRCGVFLGVYACWDVS